MYHLPSEEPINEPCAVLLEFPLAFTDVIPHQLDDESLGPVIENIKSRESIAPYFLSKCVLCCKERRGGFPKIFLQSKLEPVSYTHLDVYKRQLQDPMVKIITTHGLRACGKKT